MLAAFYLFKHAQRETAFEALQDAGVTEPTPEEIKDRVKVRTTCYDGRMIARPPRGCIWRGTREAGCACYCRRRHRCCGCCCKVWSHCCCCKFGPTAAAAVKFVCRCCCEVCCCCCIEGAASRVAGVSALPKVSSLFGFNLRLARVTRGCAAGFPS